MQKGGQDVRSVLSAGSIDGAQKVDPNFISESHGENHIVMLVYSNVIIQGFLKILAETDSLTTFLQVAMTETTHWSSADPHGI